MTDLTREQIEALLDGATQGPWQADGEPWNRIVWSSAENRVCFMAHSNGLDDARDIATSNLVATAPDLARQLLATMDALAEAQAAQAATVQRACMAVSEQSDWPEDEHGRTEQPALFERVINAVRSLADPTGAKMLAELRARAEKAEAERDKFKLWNQATNEENYRYQERARTAEAQLAEAQKREAGLRAMIRVNMLRYGPADLMHEDIDRQIEAAIAAIRAVMGTEQVQNVGNRDDPVGKHA